MQKEKTNQKAEKLLIDNSTGDLKTDPPESRTVAAKRRIREQLQSDIESFLNAGGRIDSVASNASGEIH